MPRRDSSSDSDRGSYRRRRDRKRDSSSPESRGNSESSSDRTKRKTYRSRSRSNSRSRSSRKRSRSRSLSARRSPKRYSRRSRSNSRSRTSRRSRSRSGSRSKRRGRSRSGDRKNYRRSKSTSPSRSKTSKSKYPEKDGDVLKQKVQQAIKAAANASAELREKGLLPESVSNSSTSIGDQLKRAQAIDEINSQSFVQQEFISSRNSSKTTTVKPEDNFDKDNHMSAIFGLSAPKLGLNTNPADASIKKLESWKENPEMLVHESLFVNQSGKQEHWLKKLFIMRKKKVNEET